MIITILGINSLQIFIHAGTHKTGTTSFQNTLHDERMRLLAAGICILTPRDRPPISTNGFAPKYVKNLLLKAKEAGVKKFIISHEDISLFNMRALEQLRTELSPFQTFYIIVLRYWSSYLPSRWRQNILRRDGQPFFKFLESLDHDQLWIRYDKIIKFAKNSGFDQVIVLPYESNNTVLLDRLFNLCGLKNVFRSRNANSSPDLLFIEKLRLFNAARAKHNSSPENVMIWKLTSRQSVETFDQSLLLQKLLANMRDLDFALEREINSTATELILTPEDFSFLNERLELEIGEVLFKNLTIHRKTYSSLEFDNLRPVLKTELMRLVALI